MPMMPHDAFLLHLGEGHTRLAYEKRRAALNPLREPVFFCCVRRILPEAGFQRVCAPWSEHLVRSLSYRS